MLAIDAQRSSRPPSPRSSGRPGRRRRGESRIVSLLLLGLIAFAGLLAYTFGPAFIDYMNMKEVIKAASLSWYAKQTEQSARARLDEGLTEKEIDYITAKDACTFKESAEEYVVACTWSLDVYYPGTEYYKTLDFWVSSSADRRGVAHLESSP